ncbi:MAG: imidazole glycerol phosphate synthase subunit HisH [Actinomycetota bacterium]|nr:imidazole glycerol phosphate synthase subunit HisH [Actinomycetota bacterium]
MIAVLDYGIGNLRSAEKALQRVGGDAVLTADVALASAADGVVLPGVGAFGRCMDRLQASGLDKVVLGAVERGTPLLGICVGMQMLYDGSDENPGVAGLGVLPGTLHLLPEGVKRPQMQWNRLDPVAVASRGSAECPLLAGLGAEPWVYFVHSYAAPWSDDVVAACEYGEAVVAAVARGCVWATQFHPEKSGPVGLQLLANFAQRCAPASP